MDNENNSRETAPGPDPNLTLRFFWHVDGVVAGCARPGRYGEMRAELAHLRDQGISLIVNLCTEPLAMPEEFADTFEEFHVPVLDGHPPEEDQLTGIIAKVSAARAAGRSTVIHCRGGVGRTATVLIPVMMTMEKISLDDAVNRLRKAGRYTQTMQQWEFLKEWTEKSKA